MPNTFTKMFYYQVAAEPRIMLAHKVAYSSYSGGSTTTYRLTPIDRRPASGWQNVETQCGVCNQIFDLKVAAPSVAKFHLWIWRLVVVATIALCVIVVLTMKGGSAAGLIIMVSCFWLIYPMHKVEVEDGVRLKSSSDHALKYPQKQKQKQQSQA
ncbi:hypothetical protein [Mycobacterium sp.]|uniref:hypothetical protein n=1 Tax=Mycobacterium sp. TaxID=1785 RepID=UPI002C66AE3C|nr:hypothetical protein [Mycobacterium sp.]HTQ16190.1 hypothetical protein [Mycobacterium sp.]